MSNVCQTLDVHPPTAGGMHALESKRAYASDLWVKETFFCVVGQLSVWLTLVVGSGALATLVTPLALGPLGETYWF